MKIDIRETIKDEKGGVRLLVICNGEVFLNGEFLGRFEVIEEEEVKDE